MAVEKIEIDTNQNQLTDEVEQKIFAHS